MGSGSDVAKQAADIVLMDDNFASIVKGVEEGRLMFDNIKKLLVYTMPHCFPQVWSIVLYYCFGMPIGLSALQVKKTRRKNTISTKIICCFKISLKYYHLYQNWTKKLFFSPSLQILQSFFKNANF